MNLLFTLVSALRSARCSILLLLSLLATSTVEAQSGGCGGTDAGGQPAATGLYAEYYRGYFDDDPSFFADNAAPPLLQRTEPQVNFTAVTSFGNLTGVATGPVEDPDNFSLRLRGSLNIPTAGQYTLYLTSDDAAYLWLDGAAVALPASAASATIDNGGYHTPREVTQILTLTAGLHSLLIHYGEATGSSTLLLEYSGPGIQRQVVPASLFCTASQPPRPPQRLAYAPATMLAYVGTVAASAAPTVADGGAAVTGFALVGSVPTGLTINAATGVVTAEANTPLGTHALSVAVANANGTSTFRNALTVEVVASVPPGCAGADPAGNPGTSGLYAEYFRGYFDDALGFFAGPAGSTRIEPLVNFDRDDKFGDLTAVAESGTPTDPERFSAQYRGSLRIASAGYYTFYLTADDAAYLWLDNAALDSPLTVAAATISNGGLHAPTLRQATVYLGAGLHNIRLVYGDDTGANTLILEYSGPSIPRQVVPTGILCSGVQPPRAVAFNLQYAPRMVARVAGTAGSSARPTLSSPSAISEFVIANAAALPAGITIDPGFGQLYADASVVLGSYRINVAVTNADGTVTFPDAFTFTVAAAPPTGCNQNAPNGSPPTAGLYGEYYAGYFDDEPSFFDTNTPYITRLESGLNFTADDGWDNVLPPADNTLADPDHYSARYRGSIAIPTTGDYTFYLTSDDASYLWLDNAARVSPPRISQAAIDNGGRHGPETQSVTLTLTAGLHDALLYFGEDTGANILVFEYEGPGISRQIVPGASTCTGTTGQPLPVQLTRFEAKPAGSYVNLSWSTAQELNSAYYVVERSRNGATFEAVERRQAAGTTTQAQHYALADRAPLLGLSYYRLRQVDTDGKQTFSTVVVVQIAKPGALSAAVFPNPNKGAFSVRVQQTDLQPTTLELLNLRGQVVHRQQLPAAAVAEYELRLPGLAAGLYHLRLTSRTGVATQKVVIE